MARQSALSLEYLRYQVTTSHDPTADTVQFALTTPNATPSSWVSGSWETVSGSYFAKCLVGPGGAVSPAVGEWLVWVKITDSPEVPVRQVGTLTVF